MSDSVLKQLSECSGVSGDEKSVSSVAMKLLSKYADTEKDCMGNIIGCTGQGEKHILIDAHIDEIGLIVTFIDDDGFVHVAPCGGVDRRVLADSEVIINGTEPVPGIICCQPPHLSSSSDYEKCPEISDIIIDTGFSKEILLSKITLGCTVSFKKPFRKLLSTRVSGKSLDNRAGIAALLRCAELISKEELSCKVTFLLSTQEETGERGARTASFSCYPDEAVIVDVSFNSTPGCPHPERLAKIGGGPMIGIAPSLSRDVSNALISLAKVNRIQYQLEVMGGTTGTNADVFGVSRSGVKTGLLSIPLSYMHTPVEIVDTNDIENTAWLLAAYIISGGTDNNA